MNHYSTADAAAWLEKNQLPRWSVEGDEIVRVYETGSWRLGVLLVGAIAYLAESLNHHPDVLLRYPSVTVRLSTHDAGGITELDLELARRIERLATEQPDAGGVFTGAPGGWIG
jgi:4a-hydroxytetrahydrobiopterin dehydratase